MLVTKTHFGFWIDFHGIFSPYYGSQWLPSIVWLPTFFKIHVYSFLFNRRKKLIPVWNNLSMSTWWQDFRFWTNCPFKWWCVNNLLHACFWVCSAVTRPCEWVTVLDSGQTGVMFQHCVVCGLHVRIFSWNTLAVTVCSRPFLSLPYEMRRCLMLVRSDQILLCWLEGGTPTGSLQ